MIKICLEYKSGARDYYETKAYSIIGDLLIFRLAENSKKKKVIPMRNVEKLGLEATEHDDL